MSDNQRRCTCGHTYYDEQGHERFFRFCPRPMSESGLSVKWFLLGVLAYVVGGVAWEAFHACHV